LPILEDEENEVRQLYDYSNTFLVATLHSLSASFDNDRRQVVSTNSFHAPSYNPCRGWHYSRNCKGSSCIWDMRHQLVNTVPWKLAN